MFTTPEKIVSILRKHEMVISDIEYIDKGVMTDKYTIYSDSKKYIARCFPEGREWLASQEFLYMKLFQEKGIKAPNPIWYDKEEQAVLLYEKLEGSTIAEVYNLLSKLEKKQICKEICDNYKKISSILVEGFGCVIDFNKSPFSSWNTFLECEITKAQCIFKNMKDKKMINKCEALISMVQNFRDERSSLVWSDFSMENIIVDRRRHLAGFVDFEGLISGDPLLGIGYLLARGKTEFSQEIIKQGGYSDSQSIIDFYAILRYLRILPYLKKTLPNGSLREPIENYLPYSMDLLTEIQ